MNKVCLIGWLTKEPDVRYSQGEKPIAVAKYMLAVNRQYKSSNGQDADFINCVAMGKLGEFAEKHLHKGMRIGVEGRIQTGSYTNKDGRKVYTTEVVVESHTFCETKAQAQRHQQDAPQEAPQEAPAANNEWSDIPPDSDSFWDGLPFK